MFKKVLLAVDGSPYSDKAVAVAKDLLEAGSIGSIDIVNIALGQVDQNYYMGSNISESLIAGAKESGKIVLEKAQRVFADQPAVQTKLLVGAAAKKLVDMSGNYDLIIMGSRGLNAVSRVLVGSVSSKVSQHADCPVMLVR